MLTDVLKQLKVQPQALPEAQKSLNYTGVESFGLQNFGVLRLRCARMKVQS